MTTLSRAFTLLILTAPLASAQQVPQETPPAIVPVEATPEVTPEPKPGFFKKLFGKDKKEVKEVDQAKEVKEEASSIELKSPVGSATLSPTPESAPVVPTVPSTSEPKPDSAGADKIQSLVNAPVAEGLKDDIEPKAPSHWRLGAGYAPILGMKADFAGTGNVPTIPNIAGQNREYLDGYVRVDSSGNAGGDTTFWNYGSTAQEVGGNIAFQSLAAGASGSGGSSITDSSVSAAAGFEFYGFYDMGFATILGLKDKGATWGLRTGIQYANVDLNNGSAGSGTVSTFTDTFDLGGNPAPGPGFPSSFTGPNQLLSDVALTRTFGGSTNVQISGNRSLNVHLAISQWGSYLEIPVSKKIDLKLEGGFLLALASGSYDYTNRVGVGSSVGQTVRGSNSRTRILPGFYAGLGLSYEITEHLSILTNIRYQFLRSYEITANGSTANLDFSGAYVLGISALWKF